MSIMDDLRKQRDELEGFKKETNKSSSLIKGLFIPVKIERDGGELRMYVEVEPSALDSPSVLNAVLDEVEKMFDLAVWKRQGYGGGNGFKSNNYRRKY